MIKIIGDINFSDGYFDTGFGVGTRIKNGGDPFENLGVSPKDFWIGNFECVCSDNAKLNTPFVISPADLTKINHFNLYGVANNHSMQIGDRGYADTIAFLESKGIQYVGSKEKPVAKFDHQGKKIGVVAFSQRPDNFSKDPKYNHLPEYSELSAQIDSLRDCDFKIAFIHWGYEFINYPNIDQKLLGHWLVDNGIDLLIGMHPHVMQGVECYKGKYIYYSLGNAVFKMNWEPTSYGLMVNLDLKGDRPQLSHSYLKISKIGIPHIVKNVPEEYSLPYLNSLIEISEENEKYFLHTAKASRKYQKCNRKKILQDILMCRNKAVFKMIGSFVKRRIYK